MANTVPIRLLRIFNALGVWRCENDLFGYRFDSYFAKM